MISLLVSTAGFLALVVVLIGVHEAGHFFAARACGVPVRVFSLGLGRAVWRHTSQSGVEYRLGWLPVGGYTRMANTGDAGLSPRQRARAYDAQPVNRRTLIALAGPGANLALALAIYWLLTFVGVPDMAPMVAAPASGTPAASAGLRRGDRVVAVDGTPVLGWNDVRLAVVGHVISGYPLRLTVRRKQNAARVVSLNLSRVSAQSQQPSLDAGLRLDPKATYPITARIGLIPAFVLALNETRQMTMMMLRSLDQYIFGRHTTTAGHPVVQRAPSGSAVHAAELAVRSGLATFLTFVAFISINLGVINLLPLPILDGGQIILLYGEAVTKRKLPRRARHAWSAAGLAVILAVGFAAIHGL